MSKIPKVLVNKLLDELSQVETDSEKLDVIKKYELLGASDPEERKKVWKDAFDFEDIKTTTQYCKWCQRLVQGGGSGVKGDAVWYGCYKMKEDCYLEELVMIRCTDRHRCSAWEPIKNPYGDLDTLSPGK